MVVGPVGGEEHAEPGHPERPDRVAAVMEGLSDLHLGEELVVVPSRGAGPHELGRVHSEHHLRHLREFCNQGGGSIDGDTYATSESWEIAVQAAGAGLVAIDELRLGRADLAFVAARPPGHHALADQSMGFCLVNNVAVAAASLLAAGERVAIVDWDVHHGNGTEALFWNEPRVLYVSTHQWPCYPGTGRASDVGGAGASGLTLNVPLPPGTTGDVVRLAFDRLVTPAVEEFAPTWVLVSARFDAHRADPLADLALTAGDFADLARLVSGYAPTPGRLVLFLEGGYDFDALRTSVAATLGALVGARGTEEERSSGGPGMEQLDSVATRRQEGLDRSA